jgi:hypothetical protein
MTHPLLIDEAHRRLEIENAVNRCHRRCRIANVKEKAISWEDRWCWEVLTNLSPITAISS